MQCGPPYIAKLVYNSNLTWVYGRYTELLKGGYKPTLTSLGGHRLVIVYPSDFIDASIPISIDPLVAGAQRIPSAVKKKSHRTRPRKIGACPIQKSLSSGKRLHKYGKSPFSICKSTNYKMHQLIINAHF